MSQENTDYLGSQAEYIKKLEHENKSLRSFVDSSEAGMYVTDFNTGEILYANRKTIALFGYALRKPEEMFGQTCWELINRGGSGRCPFCKHKELIGDDGELLPPHTWEHCFEEYGLWMRIISQAIIWVDGRLAQMNTFYDITELKNLQEELAAHVREAEYQRMQQNLQMVLDSLPVAVWIADLETGGITYTNRATCALFGVESPAEILGKSALSFLPERQPDNTDSRTLALEMNSGKPISGKVECLKPNGERLDLYITCCVIDYSGKRSSLGVMRDMAEEDKLLRMQRTLQEVLDTMPIPVRITDRETERFIYANNACAKLFGYSEPEEMCGVYMPDTISPRAGKDTKKKILQFFRSDSFTSTEIEYLTKDERIIDCRVDLCLVEYSERSAVLSIITDLTLERRQRQMLLNAAEKEREANKLKSSFLSNMSHEIRTPMNAIIGLSEIELRRKHSPQSHEVYKKINNAAKSLLQIINDILDLSKIEADRLELFPDEFELESVLNNALLVVSPRLEGKRVELLLDASPDLPSTVIGDKTRLWQVLKNYLDNAAKYTTEGYILLSIAENKDLSTKHTIYISFTIRDTGLGMSEEQLQKAFLPYEQVYNETQNRYTGTGLGMPISKSICELMGGTLTAESNLGLGTTVCFTIPFARCIGNGGEQHTIISPRLAGLKILAVDDNELSLMITESLLKNGGADYVLARSGKEALELVDELPWFDVILLDYVMREEDGIEIAESIRRLTPTGPEILLVTAYESYIDRTELAEHSIAGVIEKPVIPSVFFEKILIALGHSEGIDTETTACTKFFNARVLVCEDDEVNQAVAEGMLEECGITPVFAENGKAAINILNKSERFDLILMDLHMPVMDGYEATHIIRSNHKYDGIPIISLTADAMTEVAEKCLAVGMNGYLSKPFEMDDFHDMLVKWLPESKRML